MRKYYVDFIAEMYLDAVNDQEAFNKFYDAIDAVPLCEVVEIKEFSAIREIPNEPTAMDWEQFWRDEG